MKEEAVSVLTAYAEKIKVELEEEYHQEIRDGIIVNEIRQKAEP